MNRNVKELVLETVGEVLLEGRLEDVKAKYSEDMDNVIDDLSQGDPSGNNKYLDWMAKIFQETPKINEIIDTIVEYHKGLAKLNTNLVTPIVDENRGEYGGRSERRVKNNPKDINSFPSLKSLTLITDVLGEMTPMSDDRDKIYQDEKYTVIVPKTHKASCKYGVHSNWCVSTENDNYFDSHTEGAILAFVLWRNKYDSEDVVEYKIAANISFQDWETTSQWEWFDKVDNPVDPNLPLNFLPSDLINTIKKYTFDEGTRQGKIVDTRDIVKFIEKESDYVVFRTDTQIAFLSSDPSKFSHLPDYEDVEDYADEGTLFDSMYTVSLRDGTIEHDNIPDIWKENDRSLSEYKSWIRYDSWRGMVQSMFRVTEDDVVINPELVAHYEEKIKSDLKREEGMWTTKSTYNVKVGDKVRWKAGRGWYDQRYNKWNESIIDRETPSGWFVTGKTPQFPKGKRFQPSDSKMDVWVEFDDNINLKRDN